MKTSEVAVEILAEIPLFPSSTVGPYRHADYLGLPEEPRCELIYGRFYLVAPPRPLHQIVGLVLWRWLDDVALARGGQALAAPVGITLTDHSVVQPDVIYLARRATPAEIREEITGVPDLLIEVLSPGSVRRDRGLKLRLYAETGVPEYWIVAPTERHVDFLVNRGGRFELVVPAGDIYRSPTLPDITLDLAELWRQVDLRTARPA
jgi:Uma2 family endonuclease